jgi:CRISPR system Cascade subunit CasE
MRLCRIRLSSRPSAGSLFGLLTDRLGTYESHRLVWSLFGDDPDRRRDFLYRLDMKGGRPEIMAVSDRDPVDHHHLFEIESKDYAPDLREGDRLSVMARLNPIWRKEVEGKRRKVDVVMDEVHRRKAEGESRPDRLTAARDALPAWFARQGQTGGFALEPEHLVVDAYDRQRFRSAKGDDVQVAGVDLRGVLRVTDPEAMRMSLFSGLGSSKAFGYGLLLVRRAG